MKPSTRTLILIGCAAVALYLLLHKGATPPAQVIVNNPDPKCTYCPPFRRTPGT